MAFYKVSLQGGLCLMEGDTGGNASAPLPSHMSFFMIE